MRKRLRREAPPSERVVTKVKRERRPKRAPREGAEKLYFSDRSWREVYDRESQAHMTREEEWIATLSMLSGVADRRFFDGHLFKDHGIEIVPKNLHVREFYRYRMTEREGHMRHYLSVDSKMLRANDSDFGHYREGVVFILLHALCAMEAKMWQNKYWLCDGAVERDSTFKKSVSDRRIGGGADEDRAAHRARAGKVRQLVHKAKNDACHDFFEDKEDPWNMAHFQNNDPNPARYASSTRRTQDVEKGWRRMAFLRLKEICGYVPQEIRFPKAHNWKGPFMYVPTTLCCRRRG